MTEYEKLSLMLLERIATSLARLTISQHAPPRTAEDVESDTQHANKVADVTRAVREALERHGQ